MYEEDQRNFFRSLSPQEYLLYTYLHAREQAIYELNMRRMHEQTGISMPLLQHLLRRFMHLGCIWYDEETNEVLLMDWVWRNERKNRRKKRRLLRQLQGVKSRLLLRIFLRQCQEAGLRIPQNRFFGMVHALAHTNDLLRSLFRRQDTE